MNIFNFLKEIFIGESVNVNPVGSAPTGSEPDAGINDIESIFNAISKSNKNGVFVVFMPCQHRSGETSVLNIQFSIENNIIGLDWVLISPINILEKHRFIQICERHSVEVKECLENGCSYLRVEEGDLVELCKESILDLYPTLHGKSLDLVIEGFEWSGSA